MAQFIDQVQIEVQSGDGGNGAIQWRREKYEPMGGPAGGNGGRGGSVYIEATADLNTLLDFRFKTEFIADTGVRGGIKNRHGRAGQDVVIRVPVGTTVRDLESGLVIADLTKSGQRTLVAEGGQGGRGNTELASSTRRAPHFCEPGQPGVKRTLELTLKLLADVGIVGLPNAGKSTLLAALTRAKPKIADYPFSTLEPNLGVAKSEGQQDGYVLADIPGLIEGASQGVGLGHKFLKHVERTRVLVHMVDTTQEDIIASIKTINNELALYSDHLSQLPQIIALNKIEMLTSEEIDERKKEVLAYLKESEQENKEPYQTLKLTRENRVFAISAFSRVGLTGLSQRVFEIVEQMKELAKENEVNIKYVDEKAYDHGDSSFKVNVVDDVFYVEGDRAARLVSVTDLKDPDSLFSLFQRLRAMGVIDELLRNGVEPGADVVIGGLNFTYGEGMS
ncbi:MAG: GTPase [Cyanobacteriota bacterium erpe_2018_sw_39hr_WHONDRS-SW48-000098_B_bin.30]|jgi:GTP-binding protein|nr:GTPase ObgE [Candidatus Obscuribacter sp.]MBK9620185.1 GTPase ObgE [Candidatus Obscuribacter sp.]MDQ5966458.1 GTPase [Cyanobacteriota bacterium erpe_2018_sw_39hr_WHONDRS-SW48-000098_B_bin.30]